MESCEETKWPPTSVTSTLELEDYQQIMYIGEQRTAEEPVKELEEIILDESRPEWRTRMGTDVLANPTKKTGVRTRARQSNRGRG